LNEVLQKGCKAVDRIISKRSRLAVRRSLQ